MSQLIRYVTIDSRHRTSGTPSQFGIDLQPALFSFKSASLLAAAIPLTQLTVSPANATNIGNNVIYFNSAGTDYQAVVAAGAYDVYNLGPAIITAFNNATPVVGGPAVPLVVTVDVDPTTFLVSITSATAIEMKFGTYTVSSMANYLGFNSVDTTPATTTNTAGNAFNFSIPPIAFIRILEFPVSCRSAGQTTVSPQVPIPQTIYGTYPLVLTADSGGVSFTLAQTSYKCEILNNVSSMSHLTISLIDPRSGLLFDTRGVEWCMLLSLTY